MAVGLNILIIHVFIISLYTVGFYCLEGVSGGLYRLNRPQDLSRNKTIGNKISPSILDESDETEHIFFEMSRYQRVFLNTYKMSSLNFYSMNHNNWFLRIGGPFNFFCSCSTASWFRSTYLTEVSFHFCSASNSIPFESSCSSRSEFMPLFAISAQNRTTREFSFRFLSEGAAALSKDFQFSLPLYPSSLSFVLVRLPVLSVKPSFNGAFFCRVKITQSNQSNNFDSELKNVIAFGMQISNAEHHAILTLT